MCSSYSEINDNVVRHNTLVSRILFEQQKNVFLNFINVYTTLMKKIKSNLFNYDRSQFTLMFLN